MRWILPLVCLVIGFLILCGCIQSAPAPQKPVPLPTASVTVPDTTPTPHLPAVVNITARRTQDSVLIRVEGGSDAAALTALSVRIMNFDGSTVQRTIPAPETGKDYSIQYFRTANARTVNVVGTFADGYQQTLLLSSL